MAFRHQFAVPFLLVVALSVGAADLPPLFPTAVQDPLRFSSLPFDPVLAEVPAEGAWTLTAGWSWFNVWNIQWQTAALHREWGLGSDLSLSAAELRELENRYPGEDLFHIDLEGNIFEVIAVRGLGRGAAISIRVPWISMGGPHWDAIPDEWHSIFSLPTADREFFPRGASILYIRGAEGTIERRDLDDSGFGDISVALTLSPGRWLGADHRLVAAVETPTGNKGTIRGSGGWDAGFRWHGIWSFSRNRFDAGAGFNFLSSSGDIFGIERKNTWYAGVGYDHLLGERFAFNVGASYQSSPLADFSSLEPGEPALFRVLGLSTRIREHSWLSLQYGADSRDVGIAPDTSFRLIFSTRISGLPSGSR